MKHHEASNVVRFYKLGLNVTLLKSLQPKLEPGTGPGPCTTMGVIQSFGDMLLRFPFRLLVANETVFF